MAGEPGGQEIASQPEAPKNPTEASKGFLGKIGHEVREAVIGVSLNMVPGGAFASAVRREGLKREAMPDVQPKPEKFIPERLRQQDPTEASRGFLRKFTDRLFTDRPGSAQGILQPIFTGRLAQLSVQDLMQGNYPSAAVEGIIAAALAVSPIRMFNRIRQPINKS